MKTLTVALVGAAALCALSACTHSYYMEVTGPGGGTLKHVSIAPGTRVKTPAGGCINSAGGDCEQQPTQQSTQ